MKVLIDGHEVDEIAGNLDFREICTEIIRQCGRQNRVVVSIDVDGDVRTGVDVKGVEDIEASRVEVLKVQTAPVREVSLNVLKECADGIPRLIGGLSEAVGCLQSGDTEGGMCKVERALTFWLDTQTGVRSALRGLDLDFAAIVFPAKEGEETASASQVLDRINSLLEETQRAFEDEDSLEIGDILEYDLPPLLRLFQEALYLSLEKCTVSE